MIPDVGDGDTATPDDWDADSILDVAHQLELGQDVLAHDSAWRYSAPHPDTGGWLTYCWENPRAWEILAEDAPDRAAFLQAIRSATLVDLNP